jgi:hypothetical protein
VIVILVFDAFPKSSQLKHFLIERPYFSSSSVIRSASDTLSKAMRIGASGMSFDRANTMTVMVTVLPDPQVALTIYGFFSADNAFQRPLLI